MERVQSRQLVLLADRHQLLGHEQVGRAAVLALLLGPLVLRPARPRQPRQLPAILLLLLAQLLPGPAAEGAR